MPELSVIMPVKNVAPFIADAVTAMQRQAFGDWELVIVDDHSEDDTVRTAEAIRTREPRIILASNTGSGQVAALNTGYPLASGRFIKFADGDDALAYLFSRYFPALAAAEAAYHDIRIVGPDLSPVNVQRYGDRFQKEPLRLQFRPGIVHPSRSSWLVSRRIGNRVFPLPPRLSSPHEDYWIALAIKRYAASIAYVPQPLYLFRQHAGQIFGGIYNFSGPVVLRRARAMLQILDVIGREGAFMMEADADIPRRLEAMKVYYGLLSRDSLRLRDVRAAALSAPEKAKLTLIKKWPRAASILSRLKSSGLRGLAHSGKGLSP